MPTPLKSSYNLHTVYMYSYRMVSRVGDLLRSVRKLLNDM